MSDVIPFFISFPNCRAWYFFYCSEFSITRFQSEKNQGRKANRVKARNSTNKKHNF
jgi:hypothetical protein